MDDASSENSAPTNARTSLILLALIVAAIGGLVWVELQSKSARMPDRTIATEPNIAYTLADTMRVSLAFPNTEIVADVVASQRARVQGLSGRASLPDGEGLLFVFPNLAEHGIWMKDMHFSIDILWISDAREVVHIEHAVAPETYPESFSSPTPARYVLEVPAGTAAIAGIEVGDIVAITVIESDAARAELINSADHAE
jgi:uncharacterized membrane protein (UPF0127 family)